MAYELDWSALLQKAEEEVSKAEEFYGRDDPMTEIDKVKGTEMAYYESAEEAVQKLENALGEKAQLTPTHAPARGNCPKCGKPLPTDPNARSRHITQHSAETGDYSTSRNPFTTPEDIPMREEVKIACPECGGENLRTYEGDSDIALCTDCSNVFNVSSKAKPEEAVGDADRRHTSPVQGAHDAPSDVPYSQMPQRAKDLYNKFRRDEEPQKEPIEQAVEEHTWEAGEKDEAPLDAKMVKSVLDDALADATSLVDGIEKYLDTIDQLDYEDIDSAVETVNKILQSLKDAQAMGFSKPGPEGQPTLAAPQVSPAGPEKGEA